MTGGVSAYQRQSSRTGSWKRAAVLAVAAAAGSALGAARAASDPVPVQRPRGDDAISAAVRQWDAAKANAAQDAAGTTAGLPRITVPQLQTAPDAASIAPSASPDLMPSRPGSSPNWLVDAMLKPKPDDSKTRRGDPRARRSTGQGVATEKDSAGAAKLTDLAGEEAKSEQSADAAGATTEGMDVDRTATKPVNPLAKYMADWLSPQDYAVLRRTLEVPATGSERFTGVGSVSAGDLAAPDAAPNGTAAADAGGLPKPVSTPKPAENPFLEALTLPPSVPAPVPGSTPAALPPKPEPAPTLTPPATTAPANGGLPPFVKPNSDDKYFKPLKRF